MCLVENIVSRMCECNSLDTVGVAGFCDKKKSVKLDGIGLLITVGTTCRWLFVAGNFSVGTFMQHSYMCIERCMHHIA